MEPDSLGMLKAISQVVNVGSNAALLMCAWFIHRASERLARIEKALEKFLTHKE